MISPSQGAPTELGLGGHLLWYWTQGPLYSACRWAYQYTSPPEMGCWNRHITIIEDPITSNGSSASLGGMPTTVVGPLSISPQGVGDFHKPGWRAHGGSHVGLQQCIFSREEAAGSFFSSKVMGQLNAMGHWQASLLGQAQWLLLWLHQWWWSCGVGSAGLGELTSTQLEGTVAMKYLLLQ